MDVYYHPEEFKIKKSRGTAVAIGNFDGCHPGHRKILRETADEAGKSGLLPGVFTFKIHPKNLIGNSPVSSITCIRQRLDFFRDTGMSFCVMADVKKAFFSSHPETFVRDILAGVLKARIVVVGKNFHFGKNASASLPELASMQQKYGFRLITVSLIEYGHEVISSTRIREAIDRQDFILANRLLGRKLIFSGQVVRGLGLGTRLGFPTANLRCRGMNSLEPGIYAVRAWLEGIRSFGVMNSGFAPTIRTGGGRIHEIHLMDFMPRELYGVTMAVEPFEKIRDEIRFDTKEALLRQIESDIKKVRQMITRREI